MGKMLTNGRVLPRLYAPTAVQMGQGQRFTVTDSRNGAWATGAALYENGVKLGTVGKAEGSLTGDIRCLVRTKGIHQLHAACVGGAMGESEKTAFSDTVELWAVNVTCSHCHITIEDGEYGTEDGFVTYRKPEEDSFQVTITVVPDTGYVMTGGSLTVNGVSSADPTEYTFAGDSFTGDTITVTAAAQSSGIRLADNLTDSQVEGYINLLVQDKDGTLLAYYLFAEDGSIGIFDGAPEDQHEAVSVIDSAAGLDSFYIFCPSGYSGSYRFTMNGQLTEGDLSSLQFYLYSGAVEFTRLYQTAT